MQSFALVEGSERGESCRAWLPEEAGCNADAAEEHDRREQLEHVNVLDGFVKADEHDTRHAKNSNQITRQGAADKCPRIFLIRSMSCRRSRRC